MRGDAGAWRQGLAAKHRHPPTIGWGGAMGGAKGGTMNEVGDEQSGGGRCPPPSSPGGLWWNEVTLKKSGTEWGTSQSPGAWRQGTKWGTNKVGGR